MISLINADVSELSSFSEHEFSDVIKNGVKINSVYAHNGTNHSFIYIINNLGNSKNIFRAKVQVVCHLLYMGLKLCITSEMDTTEWGSCPNSDQELVYFVNLKPRT